MTKIEFVTEYIHIEHYLNSMLPDFKIKNGMRSLLEILKNNNQISNGIFNDMVEILEFRNELVGSRSSVTSVPILVAEKIAMIKNFLHI